MIMESKIKDPPSCAFLKESIGVKGESGAIMSYTKERDRTTNKEWKRELNHVNTEEHEHRAKFEKWQKKLGCPVD